MIHSDVTGPGFFVEMATESTDPLTTPTCFGFPHFTLPERLGWVMRPMMVGDIFRVSLRFIKEPAQQKRLNVVTSVDVWRSWR